MADEEKDKAGGASNFSDDDPLGDQTGDDDDDTLYGGPEGDHKRKSTFIFDEYTFSSPFLDDDDDEEGNAQRRAELAVAREADRFIEMARLKTRDYSRMDLVKMASAAGGLNLDENLVEPIPIPDSPEERTKAVRSIYGSEVNPESEPYQDAIKSLGSDGSEEGGARAERIRSPPNLIGALQSSFLKTNYKTAVFRLFVLGTHDEFLSDLMTYNKEVLEQINSQSHTEPLNGILFVYEYYYIHVLEGSEDNITKLLQKYVDDLDPAGYEWDLQFNLKSGRYTGREEQKFITVQSYVLGIFKINEKRFTQWRAEKVFPNKMYNVDIPQGGFREKYFTFMKRIMMMAFTFNKITPGTFATSHQPGGEEMTPQMKKAVERAKITRFKNLGKVVTPITFIQYILDHKDNPKLKIRTVREYMDLFGSSPPYVSASNLEWPPPGRVAPYD